MPYQRPRLNLQRGTIARPDEFRRVRRLVDVWSNGGWVRRVMELPRHISDELSRLGIIRMADDDSDEIGIRRVPPVNRR